MGDKRIINYIDGLNRLYEETGLLIESDTMLFEINEPSSRNKVIADIVFDDETNKYSWIKRN